MRFDNGECLSHTNGDGTVSKSKKFRMMLPPPQVHGSVDGLESGALCGWVVTEDYETGRRLGGSDVIITHTGVEIGRVRADRCRPDVAKAMECDPNCGFSFTPPVRYRDGKQYEFGFYVAPHRVELPKSPLTFEFPAQSVVTRLAQFHTAIDAIGTQLWRMKRELRSLLTNDVLTLADYDVWARDYQRVLRLRRSLVNRAVDKASSPLVSILCPVYRPRLDDFTAAVESVLTQTYANWELLLVDDNSRSKALSAAIAAFCARDPRIRAIYLRKNGGISAATNAAIAAAKGKYIALFDHDDLLADVAVEIMVDAALRTGAKLLYSDEDKIDDYGRFSEPNLKPDWNYRLLLSQNYLCHFLMISAEAMAKAGPLAKRYDGAQDHDLVLRLSEALDPEEIHHVPEIIYHWRKTPGSTASTIDSKSYAVAAGAAAVRDHLKRKGYDVTVSSLLGATTYQVNWNLTTQPKVCIIIPFRDNLDVTKRCLDKVLTNTEYKNYEVILVDNWSTDPSVARFRSYATKVNNVRVLEVREPFNYSRLNNIAAKQTRAKFLLFMNNDVFVDKKNWLRLLVDEALADPRVGAVGAKLLYPDQTVQHGGVILGVSGVGDHAYRGLKADDPGFMGRGICAQELSAVTAALMVCRADAFREVGGFDELDLAVAYNDLDLCLKLRKSGYRVIWTPAVMAEHHELASRGDDMSRSNLARFVHEEQTMLTRWGDAVQHDPFYNRHFSTESGLFSHLSSKSLELEVDPAQPSTSNP